MITLPSLAALRGVRHGFFTRLGGVSEGIYASLNCGFGSDDNATNVSRNRARVMEQLGVGRLVTTYQCHSPNVVTVDQPWPPADSPHADAMVTSRPGVALGILSADCTPILLADSRAGVIGAAHAGWKGALAGVVDATVAAMVELGAKAERIVAAVGPCIRQASYEVGPELVAAFTGADAGNARFFQPSQRDGHSMFDLAGFVRAHLEDAGVQVEDAEADTCADEERFFSYRRTTLHGGGDYGRNLSAIALER
ncbi:MAG: peptidoglycan editing factor PgeF [Hyphomicrobiales bacterium]|nr:peptidoglycan editing factor PgeF [Hyphomicrobiales bacterium]